ncbi:MAG: glycosyltransferase family 9 protein [Candidatus Cloacimonadia bacterium]
MPNINNLSPETVKKILIIQLGPFGDVLLTTSYFEQIKKHFPNAELTYLTKEKYYNIVKNHPSIDKFILLKQSSGYAYYLERIRTIKKIRKEKFDILIDQQNMNSTRLLTLFSTAKYKVGYKDAKFSFVYNLKAEQGQIGYTASRRFDILSPLGIKKEPYKLYFYISQEAKRYIDKWLKIKKLSPKQFICISPGSPVLKKKWSLENYAKLSDLLQLNTPYKIILLWGPKELQDVENVSAMMKTEPIMAPPTDLEQAAALLKKCKMLICNDGGLNHLSVTTNTLTLAIFGNTNPKIWSPASEFPTHHHLYNKKFHSKNDNSFGITPEMAFNKANELLRLN